MKLQLKLLPLLISLTLVGCKSDDDSDNTVLQGTWQSKEFVDSESNKPSDIIYDFNDNNFKELFSTKNDDDTYELEEHKGRFTILEETITSEGGQTTYQIDFAYDRDKDTSKKDIAFIQDGELFFGSAKEAECSDDTYEVITSTNKIIDGQSISTETTTCYTRPTKLNFSLPYRKVK